MMLTAIALLLLAAGVLAYVAAPLMHPDAAEIERVVSANSEEVDLHSRHAMLIASLADLEEDRSTGKIDDGDYERLHADLSGRAIEVLKKIDALAEKPKSPRLGPRPVA